ncbi:serine/threonine-protein kinase [Roseiflexus castenholzii]|uniref:serine/threonine-protein kinase n=1 Tax=Roseiflexus castenholzii TaxID=120962 RepID=UPI003C7AE295
MEYIDRWTAYHGLHALPRHQSGSHTHILYGATGSAFEIGRALGNGGMGCVYLARRWCEDGKTHSGEMVALKILRPHAPAQARRLFYHEGALLPRLQHPNIVRCVEYGRGGMSGSGHIDYLALEYIAGESVEDLMQRRHDPLPLPTVLGIVAQIVDALTYLHQRGVVHCDIKPGNILLEHGAPRAVLIDFGIARAPGFVGQPIAVGTTQYMAPEQADPHAACDGRADLYALGVVIFELLTRQRLFPRRTTTDLRQKRLVTLDVDELESMLDPAIAPVLARCLRAYPDERYPTARALLDDLRMAVCSGMHAIR